jgi:hypothetical protein
MDGSIRPHIDPPPPTLPPKKKHFVLGCLGIALGLFLAFFHAWTWSYGMMGAGGWGDAAGLDPAAGIDCVCHCRTKVGAGFQSLWPMV